MKKICQLSNSMKSLDTKSMGSKKNSLKTKGSISEKSSWKKDSNRHYNLQEIFDRINASYFEAKLKTKIMWSRQPVKKATRYRRLGCFMPLQNVIKINPILDDSTIPAYFIDYIVYHEMLHAVYPPIKAGGKRVVHHKKFVSMEKTFPEYVKAKAWEKKEGKKKFF